MFEDPYQDESETRAERSDARTPSLARSRIEGRVAEAGPRIPRSVNFHLTNECNDRCRFCYFTKQGHLASLPPTLEPTLSLGGQLRLQSALVKAGIERITYAGGEPTLSPHLEELVLQWHRLQDGDTPRAMIVTNGAALYAGRLARMRHALAAVKLSAESTNDAVEAALGRGYGGHLPIIVDRADTLHRLGIRVDLNSVICRLNWKEDLTPLVRRVRPRFWKVFQMLPVPGQNDRSISELSITAEEFSDFQSRHSHLRDVLVAEDNDMMRGSYAMIDPVGRFFQSTPNGYIRSQHSILEVGVPQALSEVDLDWEKYDRRGGDARAFSTGVRS